jgi:hypothetical protein
VKLNTFDDISGAERDFQADVGQLRKYYSSPMSEDTETLAELMLHAEQFCSKVEDASKDVAPNPEEKELRNKIGQCRTQLAYLQEVFNDGKLNIENPSVRANFRQLVMTLLWIAFYARRVIDFRIFRMLVRIESGFTYLLVSR